MAPTKQTKKYQKHHLKDDLKRRKDFAKTKQRHTLNAKKKSRRADEGDGDQKRPITAVNTKTAQALKAKKDLESMDMDEFFQAGLDVDAAQPANVTNGKKRKRGDDGQAANLAELKSSASDASGSDSEGDLAGHKKQIDALAEKDPEFYKFLQDEDPELLDVEDAELDLSEEEEDEDEGNHGSKKAKLEDEPTTGKGEVTKALLSKWRDAMKEQHSLRASREVVVAFRAAVHTTDDDEQKFKYSVSSPEVYHELLVLALNQVPDILQHHLPAKESANGKVRLATESKKFATLSPLVKSYLTSLIHLLSVLSDALTLRLTLQSVEALLPYALSFKKLIRDLSKSVVGIWSSAAQTDASRIAAFLVLRRAMIIGDASIRESILKLVYQGLVKGARNTTVHTLAGINLMKNAAAELWGIDSSIGYTSGFGFIRQLAIHLRSSITNKAKESYKLVYNWQYVHSLDFWSRVLSLSCDSRVEAEQGQSSQLRPLIYPLVQVSIAALRLLPTAAYFPLRFHLTRSLLRISASTGVYVPLGASLYEVLVSGEMRRPPKGGSLKALDFAVNIRAPKAYLGTRIYQDGLGEQLQELFSEFFILWAKSIAFPEMSLPLVIMIKRWLKDVGPHSKHPNQNNKVSGMISLLVQKLSANAKWIEERRLKVDYAPKDRAGVESFLKDVSWEQTPLGAFVLGQRKGREAKAKLVEEARKDEARRRDEDKTGSGTRGDGRNGDVGGGSESDEDVDSDADEDMSEED